MVITVQDISLHEVVKSIGEQLGNDQYKYICDETTMSIPKQYGRGYIKGINFQQGLGLLQLSFELKESMMIRYQLNRSHPLRLIFCEEGHLDFEFEPEHQKYTLEALHTSLTASTGQYDQIYTFPSNTKVKITVLEIDRKAYLPKIECDLFTIPDRLANVFRDVHAVDPFEYRTAYSLALADNIYQIHENPLNGLSRKVFLEAKALEMLGLMINLYVDDHREDKKSIVLRKADIQLIQEAEKILTANLKFSPTIPELAKRVGINTTKLKQGFKVVYGLTINKYLREKKLMYAAALLLNDALSIRQISDMVGYSNPAHFSQLFKERFGALPSEYTRNMRRNITIR